MQTLAAAAEPPFSAVETVAERPLALYAGEPGIVLRAEKVTRPVLPGAGVG